MQEIEAQQRVPHATSKLYTSMPGEAQYVVTTENCRFTGLEMSPCKVNEFKFILEQFVAYSEIGGDWVNTANIIKQRRLPQIDKLKKAIALMPVAVVHTSPIAVLQPSHAIAPPSAPSSSAPATAVDLILPNLVGMSQSNADEDVDHALAAASHSAVLEEEQQGPPEFGFGDDGGFSNSFSNSPGPLDNQSPIPGPHNASPVLPMPVFDDVDEDGLLNCVHLFYFLFSYIA